MAAKDNRRSINLIQFSPPHTKEEDEEHEISIGETNPELDGLVEELSSIAAEELSSIAAEELSSIAADNYVEGENVLSDLFMCLACNLTFQDVLGIFFGQSEPLNNIRPQIQQFITSRILKNQEATEENISAGVEQILAAQSFSLSEVNVREDIDFVATLDKFLEKRLHDLIELIVRTPEGVNFGTEMYNLCQVILSELVVLCVQCFTDGKASLLRMIESRLYQILNSSPIVNTMSVPPSSQVMEAYIVRRLAVAASVQPPLQPAAVVQPEDYFDKTAVIEESNEET